MVGGPGGQGLGDDWARGLIDSGGTPLTDLCGDRTCGVPPEAPLREDQWKFSVTHTDLLAIGVCHLTSRPGLGAADSELWTRS